VIGKSDCYGPLFNLTPTCTALPSSSPLSTPSTLTSGPLSSSSSSSPSARPPSPSPSNQPPTPSLIPTSPLTPSGDSINPSPKQPFPTWAIVVIVILIVIVLVVIILLVIWRLRSQGKIGPILPENAPVRRRKSSIQLQTLDEIYLTNARENQAMSPPPQEKTFEASKDTTASSKS